MLYDHFTSTGNSNKVTNDILTENVINATTSATTQCYVTNSSVQNILLKEIVPTGYTPVNIGGDSCTLCGSVWMNLKRKRNQLVRGAGLGEIEPIPKEDPCELMCQNFVASNITQSGTFKAQATCDVDQTFDTKVRTELTGKIQQSLTNQQDVLGGLSNLLTSNKDSIANSMSSSMSQNIDSTFASRLHVGTQSLQNITFGAGPNASLSSVYANNIEQHVNGNSFGTLRVVQDVTNQLRQSTSYSVQQTLLHKNDTIGDLAEQILGGMRNMDEILTSVVGFSLLIGGLVVAVGMIIAAGVYLVNDKDFEVAFIKARELTSAEGTVVASTTSTATVTATMADTTGAAGNG